jgi:hypothetical protein
MDSFRLEIATLRDLRYEREAEAYNTAYEIEDDRRRREWEAEFDTIPYRSNGREIHEAVIARRRG